LEKLKGFDEQLFFGDKDLGWRTRLLGYKIATSLSSKCYHYAGQTVKKLPSTEIFFQDYRERIYVMTKNYSLSRILIRVPISMSLMFLESIYLSLKSRKNVIAMFMKAILWNLINLRCLMKERKKVKHNKVVSDKAIEKNMVSYPFFIYGIREKLKSFFRKKIWFSP